MPPEYIHVAFQPLSFNHISSILIASHDLPGRTRRSPTTAISLPITAELSKGGLTPNSKKPKVRSLLSISYHLPNKTPTDWRSRQPCRTLIEILDNDSFLKHIFLLPAGDLGRKRGRSFENPRRGGIEPRTMVVQYRLVQVCR
jgi:hypothetical protein